MSLISILSYYLLPYQDGSCVLEKYASLESGLLANVLACEGKPGKVRA